jgi:hypothetical protein
MIEVLFYSTIAVVAVIILDRYGKYCFRLGAMSTVGALNILCEQSESGFLFYNLLNNTFITQNVDYDIGVAHLKSMYPNTDIVVSMASRTRIIDETI